MRHGSLFSGIGGFDLASEWMGWENVFHCEWNTFGQKVLNYYWPNAITYNDITKTDFTIHRGAIDIITGGFPCQPYSSAGKRLGKEDERHLWPEMLRAIREIQPTWVVGENVRGLTNWNGGLVFDEVQAELEAKGYEVTPFLLPACAVNAPHRRDRIWFVAYNATNSNGIGCYNRSDNWEERYICRDEGFAEENKSEWNRRKRGTREISSNATDSISKGLQGCTDTGEIRIEKGNMERERDKFAVKSTSVYKQSNASDSDGIGLRRQGDRIGNSRFTNKKSKRDNWQNFPTVSPICDGNDGISDRLDGITFSKWRNESIKAGGNAIVPQVVHQIFKAIEQYNNLNK
jgi:DNA (cytosine-5)-methyltransferase 1